MRRPRRISRRKSRKIFRKTASKTHRKNFGGRVRRGGIRL